MDGPKLRATRPFVAGVREALSGPAFYVAFALMSVGSLARAAGFPVGAAVASTVLLWAGPAQMLFFGAAIAKTAPLAVAFSVSLSSVRLMPMALSVLPMMREKKTPLWLLYAAAHLIAVTVWAESLRRLPDVPRPQRMRFFFGLGLTCIGLTSLSTAVGFWLAGALPTPLAAGLIMLSPIYFLMTTMRAARSGADWVSIVFGAALAPLAIHYVGGGFDLPVLALVGGGGAWLVGFFARRAA